MSVCASPGRVALHDGIQARLWGLIETGYENLRHSVEIAAAFLFEGWLEGWLEGWPF